MAQIAAAEVKGLREKTGAGMMDCKRALVEAEGDSERALEILRERGLVKARKKAGRETREGRIVSAVSPDGRAGSLLELSCETDFVAKTDDFIALAGDLAAAALDPAPGDVEALLAGPLGKGTVQDRLMEGIAILGENMRIRRVIRLEAGEKGFIGSYIHAGGKIGAIVAIEADDPSGAKARSFAGNVCMHVTALSPVAVSRNDLPEAEVEQERSALRKQAEAEGKPPQVIEKMVEGRLRKYFSEVVLLEQPLVMDPEQSVEKAGKAVGARILSFQRFQLGEELGG
ncbi:MAG: translation elongation factor Ts [Myxococcota bacterium]